MTYFFTSSLILGWTVILVPTAKSFSGLVLLFCVRAFVCSAWETAGAGMLVHTVGPVRNARTQLCAKLYRHLVAW